MNYVEIAEKASAVMDVGMERGVMLTADHFVALFDMIANHDCHSEQRTKAQEAAIKHHREQIEMLESGDGE